MGICTSEGVVLAVEKRVTSTLMEPSSIEKVLEIDSHIGMQTVHVDLLARNIILLLVFCQV